MREEEGFGLQSHLIKLNAAELMMLVPLYYLNRVHVENVYLQACMQVYL